MEVSNRSRIDAISVLGSGSSTDLCLIILPERLDPILVLTSLPHIPFLAHLYNPLCAEKNCMVSS